MILELHHLLRVLALSIVFSLLGTNSNETNSYIPSESDFQIDFNPEKKEVNVTQTLIAEKWMIERITKVQEAVARVRRLLLKKIKVCAWLYSQDIELQLPDYYFCTVGAYNNIIRRDYSKYPNGLIKEIWKVKEALYTSYVDNIPIVKVDSDVPQQLNFYLNNMSDELKTHGKLIYNLSQSIVNYQADEVYETCGVPSKPRKPNDEIDYTGLEDYEPLEYGF